VPPIETPDLSPEDTRAMLQLTTASLYPSLLLATVFVLYHNPSSPLGPLQLLSSSLTVSSRALLTPSHTFLTPLLAVFFAFATAAVCRTRCRLVLDSSTFSPAQSAALYYKTIPTTVFSTLTTLMFLLGESFSCFSEKRYNDVPDDMHTCLDVVESNATLSYFFLACACASLFIFPFLPSTYDAGSIVRFDVTFVEQCQILLMAVTLIMSVFAFASSQDHGYSTSDALTSKTARISLNVGCRATLSLAALLQVVGSSSLSSPRCITAASSFLRSKMLTRSRTSFAPILKGALAVLALFFLLPGLITVTLASVDRESQSAVRSSWLMTFAFILDIMLAGFFALSNPKGRQVSGDAFFFAIVCVNFASGVASWALLGADGLDIVLFMNFVLIGLISMVGFVFVKTARRFIALHSDAHIEQHLKRSAAMIGGIAIPTVYLFAETAGCVLTEGDIDLSCSRLRETNWAVAFQFVSLSCFFICSNIAHRHLTMDDLISFHNVDAGYTLQFILQLSAGFIAMALFGGRPREPPEAGTEAVENYLVIVVTVLKNLLGAIWLFLWVVDYLYIKHKIRVDEVLAGDVEEDEDFGRISAMYERGWEWLDDWVKRNAVGDTRPKVSNFYIACGRVTYFLCTLPSVFSLGLLIIVGKDSNLLFVCIQLADALAIPAAICMGTLMFMDLEKSERGCYRIIHPYLAGASEFLACGVEYATTGHISMFAAGFGTAILFAGVFAVKLKSKIISQTTEEERRLHVYKVVFPRVLKLIAPGIIITSEVTVCWLSSFFVSSESELMKDADMECRGIVLGTTPILLLLSLIGMWPMVVVQGRNSRGTTLQRISNMELNVVEMCQVVIVAIYSFYAVLYYSLRKKRATASDLEINLFLIISLMLGLTLMFGVYFNRSGGGEDAQTPSAAWKRNSVGARKSLWDGGLRGVAGVGRGGRLSASKRGLGKESGLDDQFGGVGANSDDVAFNPGFI
jgi:hypothetical protein